MTADRGTVHLVGAGPGAVDLLTVRAARLLAAADIVFHDALIGDDVLELAPHAVKVAVGKRCGAHSTSQRFINKRLVDAAARYCTVVRLKGGDPMLFGRAQEEIAALAAAGVTVAVVPGVTAALAGAAAARMSLTQRGVARSVVFVTPRVGAGESATAWASAAAAADTAVIYMGAGDAEAVTAALVAAGTAATTPIALIKSASRPDAVIATGTLADLATLASMRGGGPVLIVVGEVCRDVVATGVALQPQALRAHAR